MRYTLIVRALTDATPLTLVALNRLFQLGFSTIRRLAAAGQLPPFTGSALDVWDTALRLRDDGIPFCIEPDFPYNLDSPATAFGPPDGPLSNESANGE